MNARKLLRRDQFWFVDKREALEKAYLRARYGGVPFISGSSSRSVAAVAHGTPDPRNAMRPESYFS